MAFKSKSTCWPRKFHLRPLTSLSQHPTFLAWWQLSASWRFQPSLIAYHLSRSDLGNFQRIRPTGQLAYFYCEPLKTFSKFSDNFCCQCLHRCTTKISVIVRNVDPTTHTYMILKAFLSIVSRMCDVVTLVFLCWSITRRIAIIATSVLPWKRFSEVETEFDGGRTAPVGAFGVQ